MRELLVDTLEMKDAQGRPLGFDYYILVDELGSAGAFACENYGVRVVPRSGGEGMSVPGITTSISRIDDLMDRLIRGGVTPATLRDVVEDWL